MGRVKLTEEEKKQRKRENCKKWYRENKEKKLEYDRQHRKEYQKEYQKEYRKKNETYEKRKEYIKEYRQRENYKEYFKEYYTKESYKKHKKEYDKNYLASLTPEQKEERKIKQRQRQKERLETEPLYKLKKAIGSLIRNSIKHKGYQKVSRTFEILGCSYEDFKKYLESHFESWMNWDNYGNPKDGLLELNKTWDIDHKKPLSYSANEKELLELNHYTNLQPLCSYYNRYIKRDN